MKRFIVAILLFLPLFLLIVIQPSLGLALLTTFGFLGVLISSAFNKRYIIFGLILFSVIVPFGFNFIAPYQKQRIMTFLNPASDPQGTGYNSLQSIIAVGSGELFGRGLGRGIQTQLAFLPEKQTDFIFAAVSEELGFVGALLLILGEAFLLFRLILYIEKPLNSKARSFLSGLFITLFSQVLVHMGMNTGLFPVTGIPLPLVSAGGSSLVSTLIALGIASGARRT